jgi:MFS family permease
VEVLIGMRFLTGMGVGAMASCVGTLIFEYSAAKSRNLALGMVTIGYTVGVVVGGHAARGFLAMGYSWSALFVLGGVLTLLLIPLIFFVLPESLDYLISKPRQGTLARVNRVMHHLKLSALHELPAPAPQVAKSSVLDVLKEPILPRQLLMGASYFLYMFSQYFFLNWNNKLTTDAGFTVADGLDVANLTSYGGIAGGIIIGFFSTRLPFRTVATITLLVMGAGIAAFGGAAHNLQFAKITAFANGFCIFGAAVLLYATAAATFPARVRATGIGLSMGAGRLGGFLGPLVAGPMLGATFNLGRPMTCVLLAVPVLVSALVLVKVPLKPLPDD